MNRLIGGIVEFNYSNKESKFLLYNSIMTFSSIYSWLCLGAVSILPGDLATGFTLQMASFNSEFSQSMNNRRRPQL
jgi:hypothetical protein